MPYDVKIAPSAKVALEACIGTYGQTDAIWGWINSVTEMASKGIEAGSIDVSSVLDDLLRNGSEIAKKENWSKSWEFLKSAQFAEKISSLVFILSNRKPPVQLRAAKQEFLFLGAFTETITVYYEVNHVLKEVVIRHFVNLPGQQA